MIRLFEVPQLNVLFLYAGGYKKFRSDPTPPASDFFDGFRTKTYPPTTQLASGQRGKQGDTIYGAPIESRGARLATVHANQCNLVFVDGHGGPATFPMTGGMYDTWDEGIQSRQISERGH